MSPPNKIIGDCLRLQPFCSVLPCVPEEKARKTSFCLNKVGKRGTINCPAKLHKRYGVEEGALVITKVREDGVLIRPAIVVPVEPYTPERKAEFLLSMRQRRRTISGRAEK